MRRALRWLGLILSISLLLTWFVSRWCGYNCVIARGQSSINFEFIRGQFSIMHYTVPGSATKRLRARHALFIIPENTPRTWFWSFNSLHQANASGTLACYTIPLWSLFLIPAVPTTIAVARHRRATLAARANTCPRCRYSRAGLAPDAPCPECGTLTRTPPQTDSGST